MNLSKLKKSELVELCDAHGVVKTGTIPILKQRLLEQHPGFFWDLKHLRKRKRDKDDSVTIDGRFWKDQVRATFLNVATAVVTPLPQVSTVKLVSFEHWRNYVIEKCGDMELDMQELRDKFDADVHPTDYVKSLLGVPKIEKKDDVPSLLRRG